MRKLDARQLAREKSLFRYSSALERADFGTVAAVLEEAQRDPLLAQMIAEINVVYESETFRLSPSLNHSSNHQKEMLMTTLVLPNRQRSIQRWLPITLAAACVSVLFMGALMLRPIRPNTNLTGLQAQSSATPTAASTATPIPSPTAFSPTVVPPNVQQPAIASSSVTCNSQDAVILSPSSNTVVGGTVDVSGIATAPNFGSYQLEIIGMGTGSQYIPVLTGSQAITSAGSLGQINLSSYPPENYGLRLSVFDSAKRLQGSCLVNITLARTAPVPDVTVSGLTAVTAVPMNGLPISGVVTTETFARTRPAVNGTLGMTLTAGVVVKIDQQSEDGQWSHVVLDGGKNGWVLTSVVQLQPANLQVAAVPAQNNSTGTRGFVSVEQTILRDQPDANASMIRSIYHNTTVIVTETSADGQWVHITLPNGTQGWLYAKEVQTDGVPQTARPALLCWGIIGGQPAQVYSRPAISGSGVAILTLKPQTKVVIYDVDNQSGNASAWYFVQGATDEGLTVQGWVQDKDFAEHNACSLPSSPPDQFTVILPTLVPVGTFQISPVAPLNATPAVPSVPATPTAYFDSVLQSNPPVIIITRPIGHIQANTQVQIEAAGFGGINGTNWNYQIRSANGTVELVSQDDLIAATTKSSDSATAAPVTVIPANSVQVATVVPAIAQPAFSIAGTPVCTSVITVDGTTMHVTNQLDKAATIYAAPLTINSNAAVVGELPAKGEATLLNQRYDPQKDGSIGALWYLIMTNGTNDKQVTGWISANSIDSKGNCATEVGSLSGDATVPAQAQAGGSNAAASSDAAPAGMCTITTRRNESVPVYSAPSSKGDEAVLVNNLPPSMPAQVLYQRVNKDTGVTWYLILAVAKEGKEVSGWVSADSVMPVDACPAVP